MTLGKMLKYARENADLTQKSVKEKTNINNKTLSNWEHDISNPAPNDLKVLAKLYSVTVDYLLGLEPSASPTKSARTAPASATANTATANTATDTLTAEEREHLAMLRALSPEARRRVERNLKGEYEDSIDSQMQEATVC